MTFGTMGNCLSFFSERMPRGSPQEFLKARSCRCSAEGPLRGEGSERLATLSAAHLLIFYRRLAIANQRPEKLDPIPRLGII